MTRLGSLGDVRRPVSPAHSHRAGTLRPRERLRTRVDAYAQVADDLDLDAAHLADLLARWSAAVDRPLPSSRADAGSGRRRGAPPATTTEACPVCGQSFKRVAKHMSAAHPEEWAKAKDA